MPDLFTHFASGYLMSRHSRLRAHTALIVLGAVLPDLLNRLPEIVMERFLGLNIYHAVEIFHAPIILCLVALAISLLMDHGLRARAFIWIFFGSLVHVLLDLMQLQPGEGVYMPYFPMSFAKVEFGVFHFNASIVAFPVLLLIVIFAFIFSRNPSKNAS